MRGLRLPHSYAQAAGDAAMLCAGIKLADLPQDSDNSDDAVEAVPAHADVAGSSLPVGQVEHKDGVIEADDASESSSGEEEVDETVSLPDAGEQKREDSQATEQTSVQKQDN